MAELTAVGSDAVSGRELFVIEAASSAGVSSALSLLNRYFACLIAWDSTAASDAEVAELARQLLTAGCVYVCCWGPGCERVHDSFDAEEIGLRPDGPFAMSTWHRDESLADALWFVLFNAFPDGAYFDACRSTVGIAIGSPVWATEARTAFSDPRQFSARLLGGEHA